MDQTKVDMMNEARNAQWNPRSFLGDDYLRIISPAKVNLFLNVGKKRQDGYHDVETIMHALSLTDTVYMSRSTDQDDHQAAQSESNAKEHQGQSGLPMDLAFGGPAGNIEVKIEMVDKTEPFGSIGRSSDMALSFSAKDNLAFKAIDALAKAIGYSKDELITMRIEKSIPAQAGLGGGSSNAAAALIGAAELWGVSDGGETLHDVARKLGADVSFFLHGGCCAFNERGDVLERVLTPFNAPLVLVKPQGGVATSEAYRLFDEDPIKVSPEDEVRFQNVTDAASVPLVNNLTKAAEAVNPNISQVMDWLSVQRCDTPLLSGSGSCVFAKTSSYADALAIVVDAKRLGWWARAATFSPMSAVAIGSR